MTLDNLVGRNLEVITPDAASIQRLLHAAKVSLADAAVEGISNENRFDMAYKAIMQLANAALQANGYRTLTSKSGHHVTMIQSLPKTIGMDSDSIIELDALRKQRNVIDYSGDMVSDSQRAACLKLANALYRQVNDWLESNRPDLLI